MNRLSSFVLTVVLSLASAIVAPQICFAQQPDVVDVQKPNPKAKPAVVINPADASKYDVLPTNAIVTPTATTIPATTPIPAPVLVANVTPQAQPNTRPCKDIVLLRTDPSPKFGKRSADVFRQQIGQAQMISSILLLNSAPTEKDFRDGLAPAVPAPSVPLTKRALKKQEKKDATIALKKTKAEDRSRYRAAQINTLINLKIHQGEAKGTLGNGVNDLNCPVPRPLVTASN